MYIGHTCLLHGLNSLFNNTLTHICYVTICYKVDEQYVSPWLWKASNSFIWWVRHFILGESLILLCPLFMLHGGCDTKFTLELIENEPPYQIYKHVAQC